MCVLILFLRHSYLEFDLIVILALLHLFSLFMPERGQNTQQPWPRQMTSSCKLLMYNFYSKRQLLLQQNKFTVQLAR